jgi:hypothetical protein
VLLEGYIKYICTALKGIYIISKLGLLKSFIKAPVYLVKSFNMLGILEILYKKYASVVFYILYIYYIFNILGVLLFKSS